MGQKSYCRTEISPLGRPLLEKEVKRVFAEDDRVYNPHYKQNLPLKVFKEEASFEVGGRNVKVPAKIQPAGGRLFFSLESVYDEPEQTWSILRHNLKKLGLPVKIYYLDVKREGKFDGQKD